MEDKQTGGRKSSKGDIAKEKADKEPKGKKLIEKEATKTGAVG